MAITNYRKLDFKISDDDGYISTDYTEYLYYGSVDRIYTKFGTIDECVDYIFNTLGILNPIPIYYLKETVVPTQDKSLQINFINRIKQFSRLFDLHELSYRPSLLNIYYNDVNVRFKYGFYVKDVYYSFVNEVIQTVGYGMSIGTRALKPSNSYVLPIPIAGSSYRDIVVILPLFDTYYPDEPAKYNKVKNLFIRIEDVDLDKPYMTQIWSEDATIESKIEQLLSNENIPPSPLPPTPEPVDPETPPGKSTIYTNTSDRATVNKLLTNQGTVDLVYKEPTSIVNPVVMLSGDQEFIDKVLTNVNYIYLKEFNRYYYVTGMRVIRTGLVELSCHVDVLMSFRKPLYASKAVIARQSASYNLNIDDNAMIVSAKPIIKTKKFSKGLSKPSIVLAVAGAQKTE